MKPLDKAIKCVQGVTNLAQILGVGQSVVSNWRARDSVIDALHCTSIERATNGEVTRQDLRPNDWRKIWPELDVEPNHFLISAGGSAPTRPDQDAM